MYWPILVVEILNLHFELLHLPLLLDSGKPAAQFEFEKQASEKGLLCISLGARVCVQSESCVVRCTHQVFNLLCLWLCWVEEEPASEPPAMCVLLLPALQTWLAGRLKARGGCNIDVDSILAGIHRLKDSSLLEEKAGDIDVHRRVCDDSFVVRQ
jgi:hypothetical protein